MFKTKERFNMGDLEPGEGREIGINPIGDIAEVVLTYGDEHGNKYETRATVNFKERKVIKQEFKKLKVVKDVGDKYPKILIDEKVIDWGKER